MKDLHGQAILDYYKKEDASPLLLHNSYGETEEMPVEVFFREHEDFTELENTAIGACYGSILDLGAAAGAHALFLQALKFDVTALDISPGCIDTLRMSGMKKFSNDDYKKHKGKYDTILLLMNGLGLAGKLDQVPALLKHCQSLLKEGGQILADSSDISYLYEDGTPMPDGYFGEVRYQYEYKNQKGDWFDWVYVDQDKLKEITSELGLNMEILFTDENDQYLAKIY
ncbi:methyltransferase domain-containing protein [Reichenbachiella ulvae]|uniref:Methyltransferase domain-containing protein n=1 Tax=Reichenbachiella ulvae TaxID=2980104 RepID=A0ABT3CQ22_9BACT|nr:methyltransferase domain-containing protein [Reichenbachiella ulvae]MCV9385717.1 methyltransferase domain-containing protein [Reichenbachiella ulvae]